MCTMLVTNREHFKVDLKPSNEIGFSFNYRFRSLLILIGRSQINVDEKQTIYRVW